MARRILIIDDNKDDLRLITECIKEEFKNDEVSTAFTGEAGIATAAEFKPDIVIIDTILPGIDGFEVCQRLKQKYDDMRAIVITGSIDAIDAKKAMDAGADDYCAKTSHCGQILDAIRRV